LILALLAPLLAVAMSTSASAHRPPSYQACVTAKYSMSLSSCDGCRARVSKGRAFRIVAQYDDQLLVRTNQRQAWVYIWQVSLAHEDYCFAAGI
jgi:hypothetical protein